MAAASSKNAFVRSNASADGGRAQVLVVNLGTPRAPTPQAVREFLAEFLSDPMVVDYPTWLWRPILDNIILNVRPGRVAEWYASIADDGRMPLAAGTEAIAGALQEALGSRARVRVAYRYGSPAVGTELVEAARHAQQVVVLPLFPQTTASSLGTILVEARRAASEAGVAHKLRFAVIAPDDPGYIGACAARVREAIAGRSPRHLLVSFHSLPRRHDRRERGRYRKECGMTANALVDALGWPRADMTLAYQSRFGPEPWIGPATAAVLRRLPAKGIRDVVVVTPGFITDGLETLDEIGVRGRELFLAAGGTSLICVPAVTAHDAFIESLHALVIGRISAGEDVRGEAYAS
jgi:ferrochelatase